MNRGDVWLSYHVVNALSGLGSGAAIALPIVREWVNWEEEICLMSAVRQFVARFADPAVLAAESERREELTALLDEPSPAPETARSVLAALERLTTG